jgi:hypothetical protein
MRGSSWQDWVAVSGSRWQQNPYSPTSTRESVRCRPCHLLPLSYIRSLPLKSPDDSGISQMTQEIASDLGKRTATAMWQ